MKVVATLNEYWAVDKTKRKYFCIGEELLNTYPTKDNGEELIDVIEYFSANDASLKYEPPKEIAEMKQKFLLRKTPAALLLKAAKKLPKAHRFLVSEGYRPLWYQRQIFKEITDEMKQQHPSWSKKKLWEEATLYVADPSLTPPHSTGGTLDVTIIDGAGEEIDMGNALNTVGEKSNTFAEGLTKNQEENRLLLYNTLEDEGFVNLASEWWHYSYGDQYWAVAEHEPHAIYGSIDI